VALVASLGRSSSTRVTPVLQHKDGLSADQPPPSGSASAASSDGIGLERILSEDNQVPRVAPGQ
jgi:hypothetical protein